MIGAITNCNGAKGTLIASNLYLSEKHEISSTKSETNPKNKMLKILKLSSSV